jgi:hypothetical protein
VALQTLFFQWTTHRCTHDTHSQLQTNVVIFEKGRVTE